MEQKRFFVTAKNQDLSLGYLSGPVSPPFNNPFCAERAIKKPLLSNRRRGFKSFLPSLSPLPRSIAGAFPLPWIAHETSSEAKGLLQNGRKGKAAATAQAKKRRLIVPRFPPFSRCCALSSCHVFSVVFSLFLRPPPPEETIIASSWHGRKRSFFTGRKVLYHSPPSDPSCLHIFHSEPTSKS